MGSLMNKKGLFHKIQAYIKPRVLGEWPLFDRHAIYSDFPRPAASLMAQRIIIAASFTE